MSSIERISLVVVAAVCIAACDRDAGTRSEDAAVPASPAARVTAQMEEAAQAIGADYMRGVVAELADDRYAGRLPGTEGDVLARTYLAGELSRLGFTPLAPGNS